MCRFRPRRRVSLSDGVRFGVGAGWFDLFADLVQTVTLGRGCGGCVIGYTEGG
jgi:hypothetical protein